MTAVNDRADPVDVLAFGAHPDDVELGCGGTLLVSADAGLRVGVVDLTAGEMSTSGTSHERARERDRASDHLGLFARVCLDLPDAAVGSAPEHRLAVVEAIRSFRPRIVLAPHVDDRHPDHGAAGRLVRDSCFLAGVGRVGEGTPHRPARVYHYLIHSPFTPSFVVDISSVWGRKVAAVQAYRSQFGTADPRTAVATPRFAEVAEARAVYHGAMIGVDRGEPFLAAGPVPAAALPDLGVPAAAGAPSYHLFQ
jgi:N-acetylglucosamine malate deacetylase 1